MRHIYELICFKINIVAGLPILSFSAAGKGSRSDLRDWVLKRGFSAYKWMWAKRCRCDASPALSPFSQLYVFAPVHFLSSLLLMSRFADTNYVQDVRIWGFLDASSTTRWPCRMAHESLSSPKELWRRVELGTGNGALVNARNVSSLVVAAQITCAMCNLQHRKVSLTMCGRRHLWNWSLATRKTHYCRYKMLFCGSRSNNSEMEK